MTFTIKQLHLFQKYSQHSDAPSAQVRSWEPGNNTAVKEKPSSINHVEGNNVPDDAATKTLDVSPSNSATKKMDKSPSNSATKDTNNAADTKAKPADTKAKPADTKAKPAAKAPGTKGNGPTSSDVRSPTSSEVRSPTSSEVRSPTSTSTEVRSPTSTSTEAYTADNFTATVTGGAGAGATSVNIYPGKQQSKEKKKASFLAYVLKKYG